MEKRAVAPGDVLSVVFPTHLPPGHEQEGPRPVVVVGVPTGPLRYPVILVVPLTSQTGAWASKNPALYPKLPIGAGGLTLPSTVLLDQLRAIDARRVQRFLGSLSFEEYLPIGRGLSAALTHQL